MGSLPQIGRLIMLTGIALTVAGICIWRFPAAFQKFGRLPGDIAIEGGGYSLWFPITTAIILSIFLSGFFFILSRLIR